MMRQNTSNRIPLSGYLPWDVHEQDCQSSQGQATSRYPHRVWCSKHQVIAPMHFIDGPIDHPFRGFIEFACGNLKIIDVHAALPLPRRAKVTPARGRHPLCLLVSHGS